MVVGGMTNNTSSMSEPRDLEDALIEALGNRPQIARALVEHRVEVLALLGMEQVGWFSQRYGLYGRHADAEVLRRVSAVAPVYAAALGADQSAQEEPQ